MNLEKILDNLNIPKAIFDRADKFLGVLLDSATKETGELIADKVRYRRFKNQISILKKAEDLILSAGLKPKAISLKLLVPLIESSSLEEDSTIQDMWARLLVNAVRSDAKSTLHSICIEVLSRISPLEAKVLKLTFQKYVEQIPQQLAKRKEWGLKEGGISSDSIVFKPHEMFDPFHIKDEDAEFLLDNLLRLGLLRYEIPKIEKGENIFPDYVHLTSLGVNVLQECTKNAENV